MMLHLNSGLLLRKPGESAYAASRRFAMANRSLTYSELVAEARQRLFPDNIRGCATFSLIARLARQVESEHCRGLGITPPSYSLNPPDPFSHSPRSMTIRRNCPVCAESMFHSPLYELPWLKACPIHHRPLTDACPGCGKGWPAISELWTRSCSVCGIIGSCGEIMNADANPTAWDFSSLKLVQRSVEYQQLWVDTSLLAGEEYSADPFEICAHVSIKPRNCFFPSVVSDFDWEFRNFCKTHRIYIEPCIRLRFKCSKIAPDTAHYDPTKPVPQWITDCRKKTSMKIAAAVARSAGPSHHLTARNNESRTRHCAYCRAFSYWCDLIKTLPLRSSESFWWSVTLGRGLGMMPPTPQPMQVMTIHSLSDRIDAELSCNPRITLIDYELPLTAQRFFYMLDLWTTFVALFQNIEYRLLTSYQFHIDPRQQYPFEPNYHESISRSLAFWKNDSDEINVLVPKSLFQPRLQTQFSSLWATVCIEKTAPI